MDGEATQNIDGHDNFNDVTNMTQDAWIQMQLDLGMGIKDLVPFEVDREDIQPKNDAYRKFQNFKKARKQVAKKYFPVSKLFFEI